MRALFEEMITFPLESILIASAPPSLNAIVSAAGKNKPVLVSPVGMIAGAAAVPVPVVMRVVATRVGIVPVVLLSVAIVPVVLLRVAIVPLVIVAAVEVVVPAVRLGITPVVIVPVVIVALAETNLVPVAVP